MQARRVTFREIRPADAGRIAMLAGDWDIARMTARIPYPYSERLAREWIGSLADGEFVRAIELDGELIGAVGYVPAASESAAEIGYWIGKPWWGRGLATEAARALVKHCFEEARFARLTCCHFVDNPASARVIRKLGFRRSGACTAWCDARQEEVAIVAYEKRRPFIMPAAWSVFRRRAEPRVCSGRLTQ